MNIIESEFAMTPSMVRNILLSKSNIPFSQFAAAALLSYDWALTLDMEINFIWMKDWNLIKVIYLIQRYGVIIDACALPLYRQLGSNMIDIKCDRIKVAVAVMTVVDTLASEAILTVRVWAIWSRDKRLSIIICTVAAIIWTPAIVSIALYFTKLKYSPTPIYQGYKGCLPLTRTAYIVWWWAALCIWDTLCLLLVLKPAVQFWKSKMASRLPLSVVIYRDGVIFYVVLFLCSFFNVLSYKTFPTPSVRSMGIALTRSLHSVLASRALLQMREQLQIRYSGTGIFSSAFHSDAVADRNVIAPEDVEHSRATIEIS